MSEVEQEKTPFEMLREQFGDEIYTKTKWQGRQADWLLQYFVQFVNDSPIVLPVTLSVGGNLVSGQLISDSAYFDQLTEDFSQSMTGEIKESAKSFIQALKPKPTISDDETDQVACQFIHIKNAQVFTDAGKPIVADGTLWRGKIAAVDGFSFGSLAFN